MAAHETEEREGLERKEAEADEVDSDTSSGANMFGGNAASTTLQSDAIASTKSAFPGKTGSRLAGPSNGSSGPDAGVLSRVRSFFGQPVTEGLDAKPGRTLRRGHTMRVPPPAVLRDRQPVFMKLLKRTKTALIRAQARGELSAPM